MMFVTNSPGAIGSDDDLLPFGNDSFDPAGQFRPDEGRIIGTRIDILAVEDPPLLRIENQEIG